MRIVNFQFVAFMEDHKSKIMRKQQYKQANVMCLSLEMSDKQSLPCLSAPWALRHHVACGKADTCEANCILRRLRTKHPISYSYDQPCAIKSRKAAKATKMNVKRVKR